MFLVRGLDGIQRAFVPGEIRARRQVAPVMQAAAVDAVRPADGSVAGEQHSQREALISRYQNQSVPQESAEVRFAREIMTSPVSTVPVTASIGDVTQIFTEKRFRHIPIVIGKGRIAGLISDRDILRQRANRKIQDPPIDRELIDTIMVKEVLIATPETTIREIAQVMVDERVGSIPIVDEQESVVGMITRSDIVRAVVKHGPMRMWA